MFDEKALVVIFWIYAIVAIATVIGAWELLQWVWSYV